MIYPTDAQGIFDTTAQHLFQQGKRATVEVLNTTNEKIGEACRYRGDNGLMCAAGRHIKDDEYRFGMEGNDIHCVVFEFINSTGFERLRPHVLLLSGLQDAHDNAQNWQSTATMRAVLRDVADQRGLNPAILDTLSFADGR
jgi:hypothetical protein